MFWFLKLSTFVQSYSDDGKAGRHAVQDSDSRRPLMVTHPLFTLAYFVNLVLVPDTPETASHAENRRTKGDPVRRTVAHSALQTFHIPCFILDRMAVVDASIQEIENVTGYDGRQRHCAPVLAETVHAKAVRNKAWIDAEEHAVCKARQAG